MVRRTWCFIGRSPAASTDEIRQYMGSVSAEEGDCLSLYTMLLSQFRPGPDVGQWISFAFCACDSQEAEMELSQSYTMLIKQCTFQQFLNAYKSNSLLSLFRQKNIKITDPFIIDILSDDVGNKSVWDLKQYIELRIIHGPEDTTIRPVNSVIVDYGFYNCKTEEEQKLLFDLYKGFFALRGDANPLQLHKACIQGRLYTYFAQDLMFKVKPKKAYERLLKNPYPLPDL